MIKVNKRINLAQLDKEINGLGLNATRDESGEIEYVGLTENNPATEDDLKNAIKNHIAEDEPDLTVEQKLASVGLSVDDLKIALGL